jgi:hypothetical protein
MLDGELAERPESGFPSLAVGTRGIQLMARGESAAIKQAPRLMKTKLNKSTCKSL